MTGSQRVILNTVASYGRSVVSAGLALLGSRWVLNALGQTDFGLFALVGTLVSFVSFLNGVLGNSAGRYFAFAMGTGDTVGVKRWFNTAFSMHVLLPAVLIAIGWPVGEVCIRRGLEIPPERVGACLWVLRLSLMAAFANMVSVPYVAMFCAKQRIVATSLWGLLQATMVFLLAFGLFYVRMDRLLAYAAGMVGISIVLAGGQILHATVVFSECRLVPAYWSDRGRAVELLRFAGWSLIGCLGGLLRNQGTAIILNLFFGPRANAGYGIANQVATQAGTCSQAMMNALWPEMTATAGRDDRQRLVELGLSASRLGTLLTIFFAVPLLIEMPYILHLWLTDPPAHTAAFCRYVIIAFVVDNLTAGHMLNVNAQGRIAIYQLTVGGLLVLTLPIACLLVVVSGAPAAALVAFLVTSVACAGARVYWGKRLVGMSPARWTVEVLARCSIACLAAAALGALPRLLLPPSVVRLALTVFVSLSATALAGWFACLTSVERAYVVRSVRRVATIWHVRQT
jgi:O-antigen/teichoic acid export membrane protein